MLCYRNCLKKFLCFTHLTIRRKHKDTHWSVIAKKKTARDKALLYFDDLYKGFYGSEWPSIRLAILSPSKYCAVVNNFGDTEDTISNLKKLGAVDMQEVFRVESLLGDSPAMAKQRPKRKLSGKSQSISQDQIQSLGGDHSEEEAPAAGSASENGVNEVKPPDSAVSSAASLRSQLSNSEIEHDRLLKPDIMGDVGFTAALGEFVPATKLKGLEDWVLESEHYHGYEESSSFPIIKKEEESICYPKYWNIFSRIRGDVSGYPPPKRGKTGVYNYYLLDAASILPVLALDLTYGDRVLDMCAAPGGKSFLILQTLYPEVLVSNDLSVSRSKRIKGIFDNYFLPLKNWEHKMAITQRDGRCIDEANSYDKILVDVPCTTDRHTVMENDNNIFNPMRLKERVRLPEVQAELLSNALKIVRPGGTIVYSTCSLSPIQNDGVVHMALKRIWEETKIEIEVRDMTQALQATKNVFKFPTGRKLQYGHIVLPFIPNNFGPTYFCKLVRSK